MLLCVIWETRDGEFQFLQDLPWSSWEAAQPLHTWTSRFSRQLQDYSSPLPISPSAPLPIHSAQDLFHGFLGSGLQGDTHSRLPWEDTSDLTGSWHLLVPAAPSNIQQRDSSVPHQVSLGEKQNQRPCSIKIINGEALSKTCL